MLVPIQPTTKTHPNLLSYRRRLIRKTTPAERAIATLLKSISHIRQAVFVDYTTPPTSRVCYISDFYLPKHALVIELDGNQHYTPTGRKADTKRDSLFLQAGIRTIRFRNRTALALNKSQLLRILGI